jgi:hypothetical protein
LTIVRTTSANGEREHGGDPVADGVARDHLVEEVAQR